MDIHLTSGSFSLLCAPPACDNPKDLPKMPPIMCTSSVACSVASNFNHGIHYRYRRSTVSMLRFASSAIHEPQANCIPQEELRREGRQMRRGIGVVRRGIGGRERGNEQQQEGADALGRLASLGIAWCREGSRDLKLGKHEVFRAQTRPAESRYPAISWRYQPRPVFHWELLPVPPELEPSATVEVDAVVLLRFTPRSAAAASAPVAGSTASPLEIDRRPSTLLTYHGSQIQPTPRMQTTPYPPHQEREDRAGAVTATATAMAMAMATTSWREGGGGGRATRECESVRSICAADAEL
ncbi:hypothetical protein R3P38DRAFT_2786549 [Favolaschia claudopus]|uniref:Uncharacterized protein n=1 Tax=Favolaschia claudopus TaxID=2862362 RepID=A0AAW0AR00_9AGAR